MSNDSKTIWLIVRGICGNPDNCQEWEQRAVDWIHQRTDMRARCDSYRCSALTVWLHERERAESFAKVLQTYSTAGFTINCIGHSNGTKVILEGMRLARYPRVEQLHLVCGACDSNFNSNGLNYALQCKVGGVGKVWCYIADDDLAMWGEDTFMGKWLFRIVEADRPLGLYGPDRANPSLFAANKIQEVHWEDYGHSTCWDSEHFERTLKQIVNII